MSMNPTTELSRVLSLLAVAIPLQFFWQGAFNQMARPATAAALGSVAEPQFRPEVLVADFPVGENSGSAAHSAPAMAELNDGGFVAVWADTRNGTAHIFGQVFDAAGATVRADFQISEDIVAGNYNYYKPNLAVLLDGSFIVVWQTSTDGASPIIARRMDPFGDPLGSQFEVNDDALANRTKFDPHVSALSDTGFVVVWSDNRNSSVSSADIYGQLFDGSGQMVGVNFVVNDSLPRYQFSPVVSRIGNSHFMVAWADARNSTQFQYEVFGQVYDSLGAPIGPNFQVDEDLTNGSKNEIRITSLADGGAAVVWYDNTQRVYGQRYDSQAAPVSGNFRIAEGGLGPKAPSVIALEDSGLVVAWLDRRAGRSDSDVYAQRYDASTALVGSDFLVEDSTGLVFGGVLGGASVLGGGFVIAWISEQAGAQNVHARRYYSTGLAAGGSFRLNDDSNSSSQVDPAAALLKGGGYVVVWSDDRIGPPGTGDIFGQIFDSTSTAVGVNFLISDSTGFPHRYPEVAGLEDSGFVVVWSDVRDGNDDIFAQRFDSTGAAVGANYQIDDDPLDTGNGGTIQWHPTVEGLPDGGFIVAWEDWREGIQQDIYARQFDVSGAAVGAGFLVNTDGGTRNQKVPAMVLLADSSIVIAWHDNRAGAGNYDIYVRHYDKSLTPMGAEFRVNSDNSTYHQWFPSLATLSGGGYVVAWSDDRLGRSIRRTYAQQYDASDAPIGSNIPAEDASGQTSLYNKGAVAGLNNGRFAMMWSDTRSGARVYAQQFESSGVTVDRNYAITQVPDASRQFSPVVLAKGNKIFMIWVDNREQGKGNTVFASYLNMTIPHPLGVDDRVPRPVSFEIYQNYPNPFNPSTTLGYHLPRAAFASIVVYDLLGRKIKQLVNEDLGQGYYDVTWDGQDKAGRQVPSGIYIARLVTPGYTKTIKMVLLK